jgi:hypothetical protein
MAALPSCRSADLSNGAATSTLPPKLDNADPISRAFDLNQSPSEQRRLAVLMESQIAICMKAEGFEYYSEEQSLTPSQLEEDLRYTDPNEYGKRYGYGVVRIYELIEEPQLRLAIATPSEQQASAAGVPSRNLVYQSTLTENELKQYDRVLNGVVTQEGQEVDRQGCTSSAHTAVYGESVGTSDEFQQALALAYENLNRDPRMNDALDGWVECMTSKDSTYSDLGGPSSAYLSIEQEKQRLLGIELVDPAGELVDLTLRVPSQIVYRPLDPSAIAKPIPEDSLGNLRRRELRTWADDTLCQQQSGVDQTTLEIEDEIAHSLAVRYGSSLQARPVGHRASVGLLVPIRATQGATQQAFVG